MKVIKYPPRENWGELVTRPALDHSALFETVKTILDDVRQNGDRAVLKYEEKFDGVALQNLSVTDEEIDEALTSVPDELKNAVGAAKANIETFHRAQQTECRDIETAPGVVCRQKAVAIEKVGLYIPGGNAPLFSTVLMLAVPAHIAGCREIVLCTPPDKNGKISPEILFTAHESGVGRIFKIGGIQAVAAMAYGTESVPAVYKIFGPGNQYVTAAKQLVALRDVAIDMPAGPSEVEVMADATADPAFVAADMLSQAEHGSDSQAVLVTVDEPLIEKVLAEIEKQLNALPRKDLAEKSLQHSRIILLKNRCEMIDFTNMYAPEHLIIQTEDYTEPAEQIINAGSVFLGPYTPESAGDYASGTNHTLPAGGYAKMYGGVNLDSFVRKITFQEITRDGIRNIGRTAVTMARAESMHAHANALLLRMNR